MNYGIKQCMLFYAFELSKTLFVNTYYQLYRFYIS